MSGICGAPVEVVERPGGVGIGTLKYVPRVKIVKAGYYDAPAPRDNVLTPFNVAEVVDPCVAHAHGVPALLRVDLGLADLGPCRCERFEVGEEEQGRNSSAIAIQGY